MGIEDKISGFFKGKQDKKISPTSKTTTTKAQAQQEKKASQQYAPASTGLTSEAMEKANLEKQKRDQELGTKGQVPC